MTAPRPQPINGERWPAATTLPAPSTPTDTPWSAEQLDRQVRPLRERVATRLERLDVADREDGRGLSARDERARARGVLAEEVESWIAERAERGMPLPTAEGEQALVEAVWAALFGLGTLQPLLDRDDVENVHIHGHDRVALELADGRVEWWPYPVAESDDDLVRLIADFAARMGQTGREFSPATPILNLRLPTGGPLGSRLAAAMEVTDRPRIAIRRHRLVAVTLDQLAETGTLSPGLAAFLRAAVRAGINLVVSGGPAAGKTTLLRALCQEIRVDEHVVTVEEEYELGLHLDTQHNRLVTAMEVRYPNAEGAGGIDLHALVNQALRQSPHRVVVGEVRGGEVTAMLRALGNGAAGGMCTLHAASAEAVFDRIASLGQLADPPMPVEAAYRWTAQAIQLVVHVRRTDHIEGGRPRRERYVREVLAVGPVGDSGRPDITRLYRPRASDGHAEPDIPPDQRLLAELALHGFDPAWFAHPGQDGG